jgi:hypothetical protein
MSFARCLPSDGRRFFDPSPAIAVFRDADGALHWSDYDGRKVKAAFPAPDGERCIVLLDHHLQLKGRFENLFLRRP